MSNKEIAEVFCCLSIKHHMEGRVIKYYLGGREWVIADPKNVIKNQKELIEMMQSFLKMYPEDKKIFKKIIADKKEYGDKFESLNDLNLI